VPAEGEKRGLAGVGAYLPGRHAKRSKEMTTKTALFGRKLRPAFAALPPSMAVGRKLRRAFAALPPFMAVGCGLLVALLLAGCGGGDAGGDFAGIDRTGATAIAFGPVTGFAA